MWLSGYAFVLSLPAHVIQSVYNRLQTLYKIEKALALFTDLCFKDLDLKSAMMVVAAYEHNILMMQKLAPKVSQFLNQDGVWQALAELFVKGEATNDVVAELKRSVLV